MSKNIDLDLLRTFLNIHALGSFHAAGERLGRTQPAISLQMRRLEEMLGKPVFERAGKRVQLSPVGEVLLEHARKMIDMNDEAYLRIRGENASGILKIGAPEAITSTHLPRILSLFARSHPSVSLEITSGMTEELLEQHHQGEYDIVIFKKDGSKSDIGETIHQEKLRWVCSVGLGGLSDPVLPVILSPPPCLYRKKMLEALERGKIKWRTVMTTASLAGRMGAALAGLGVTALAHDLIDSDTVTVPKRFGLPDLGIVELGLLQKSSGKTYVQNQFYTHVRNYFSG